LSPAGTRPAGAGAHAAGAGSAEGRRRGRGIPARAGLGSPAGLCLAVLSAFGAARAGDGIGSLEGRAHSYRDDARLEVSSLEGAWEHPLAGAFSLRLGLLADWITILAPPAPEAADPHAGHAEGAHDHMDEGNDPAVADAISGASARAIAGGGDSRELRAGGSLGLSWRPRPGNIPVTLSLDARASREPDYLSGAGILSGRIALFRANTVIAAFAGMGRDEIDPPAPPPGQAGLWPARQAKLSGGLSVSQSLSPRLQIAGGASAALQSGRLSSPYRSALIGATYFPERLPGERVRATAFASAAWYCGWGTALHLREGLYADDWGVRAFIPEAALAKEMGPWLATLRHRFYAQTRAGFYRTVYPDLDGFRTGDARLGRLYDQTGALGVEYRMGPRASPVLLSAEYLFSHLEYPDLYPRTLLSQVFTLGIRTEY
jgi:hypothetical protein